MRIIAVAFISSLLLSCSSTYRTSCNESHTAVEFARSLTQQQLKQLHIELFRLRDLNEKEYTRYGAVGDPTPESLTFLNAVIVEPNWVDQPLVTLAVCFEGTVLLWFYDGKTDSGPPRVGLSWFESEGQKLGRQELWRAED